MQTDDRGDAGARRKAPAVSTSERPPSWTLDPDRLLPADDTTRTIARDLYDTVADAPIISPHGHVPADLLLENRAFPDPSALFITQDHYVTRLLHASGTSLEALGLDGRRPQEPREIWRRFCTNWHYFGGTASGGWLQHELVDLFGVTQPPSAETADELFDSISARLASADMLPRTLFDRFRISVLATTDDPLDDLAAHRALADDTTFPHRVVPTFRPDRYIDPAAAGYVENVERLTQRAGTRIDDFSGYLDALADRRRHFIDHGAVSADHGVLSPLTLDLDRGEAESLYRRVLQGTATAAESEAFGGHMLFQMGAMSARDGLVMTIHAGVQRNHHAATFAEFGPDTGHDIPVATEFTRNLRPLLQRFGARPDLHIVLFAVDETTYSREIAPLAGFYPSVFIGAPWWFLDAPDAIRRFRSATTETAGFYRGSGFIDDTRAFLSIPARHDTARRLDAGFLAGYVREGRLSLEEAGRIAVDLVDGIPKRTFKL